MNTAPTYPHPMDRAEAEDREANAPDRPATDEGEGPPPGDAYWEG